MYVTDTCVLNSDAAIESNVSVLDELSCSAIDISASASSCRLASVIGSRLAWTRDSPHAVEHSDAVVQRGIRVSGGLVGLCTYYFQKRYLPCTVAVALFNAR